MKFSFLKTADERLTPLPETDGGSIALLDIIRIAIATVLILVTVFTKTLPEFAVTIILAISALAVGYDIILSTVYALIRRNFFCDGLPIILAAMLAFFNGMALEAAIAMVIFKMALSLRSYAFSRTRGLILATVCLPTEPDGLSVGDTLSFEGGQVLPTNCDIIKGAVTVDLTFARGERVEKNLKVGDKIPAGAVCLGGNAVVEVTALRENTSAYKIEKTIENGYSEVTETERRISEISKFLPILILFVGVVLLILLPILTDIIFAESLRRVISIIAIASPCGILLSIPLIYLSSMAEQRKQGTIFKSSTVMDNTATVKAVVFDKAGTVTADAFTVTDVFSDRMDQETFLKVAAFAAYGSSNPIARALVKAYGEAVSGDFIKDFEEFPGWGVSVTVNDIKILLGTEMHLERNGIELLKPKTDYTVVYVAVGGIMAGYISLEDAVSPVMSQTIADLAANGIDRISMVSEDSRQRDSAVANDLGISEYFAECTDEKKAQCIKEIRTRMSGNGSVIYACGKYGSQDACRAADLSLVVNTSDVDILGGDADILIMGKVVYNVPRALIAAKRTRRMVLFCVGSGILIKLILVGLAATGLLPLWFTVLFDSCLSLGLIIASYSIFKIKE